MQKNTMIYYNPVTLEETEVTEKTVIYAVLSGNFYFIRALEIDQINMLEKEPLGRQEIYWPLSISNMMFDESCFLKSKQAFTKLEIQKLFNFTEDNLQYFKHNKSRLSLNGQNNRVSFLLRTEENQVDRENQELTCCVNCNIF